jgi:cyclohexadienyl dehydratase
MPRFLLGATLALLLAFTPAARADARYLEERAAVARVLDLADQRLALMPDVAAAKWATGQPVADPARESAVADSAAAGGARLGLAAAPVRALFELQIAEARRAQQALIQQWREGGSGPSGPAPDLARDLRPRLDELLIAQLRAIYLAAAALERQGFVESHASLARERLPDTRWTKSSRSALLTALGHIRRDGPATLARAEAAGYLRIGTPGDYAPFSVEAEGQLSGSDIALTTRLAAALGLEAVFVRTSWGRLLDDLAQDRYDLAVGGISVTAARSASGRFSVSHASGGKTAIGRCRDTARYDALEDIDHPGVRVIVNPGGTNEQFVRGRLHQAEIRVHPDNRTVFEEILAGRADVMITDDTEVELQTRRHAELCRLLPGTLDRVDKAFLLQPDEGLARAVDGWLGPVVGRGEALWLLRQAEGGAQL